MMMSGICPLRWPNRLTTPMSWPVISSFWASMVLGLTAFASPTTTPYLVSGANYPLPLLNRVENCQVSDLHSIR